MSTSLIALLLLGGAGKRLWPISSEQRPKQFLKLFGDRSLFQLTVERIRAAGVDEIVIITNHAHEEIARRELQDLAPGPVRFVLEPIRRDSGPAIAAGVAHIVGEHGADTGIAVFPADHLIPDVEDFAAMLGRGAKVASAGWITTFGIKPTAPSTEYGYIQRGAAIAAAADAFAVARFHEKPQAQSAEAYLRSGDYDWNSGMFVFSGATFAREAQVHMPDIWDAATLAVERGVKQDRRLELGSEHFGAARKTSIDFALMEKSQRVAVVRADLHWSDIGNWNSIYEAHTKDEHDNVVLGEAKLSDCRRSLVIAEGPPVAVTGLEDMIVVCGPSGSFVAPRALAASVKTLIEG
jgi:mannose-1-phosphate guanylyltransferase/mannose-6-phosphate isomerase